MKAGDISELEARAVRSGEARILVMRRALEHDRNLARLNLAARLGMNTPADRIQLVPAQSREPTVCGTESSRLEDALASRPDVRAAEIGIEAATQRAAVGALARLHADRHSRWQQRGSRRRRIRSGHRFGRACPVAQPGRDRPRRCRDRARESSVRRRQGAGR